MAARTRSCSSLRATPSSVRSGDILGSVKKPWDPNRWTYTVEEVRNGLYEAAADDHQGSDIRRKAWCATDAEVEALLQGVKNEAAELTRRRQEAAESNG